MRSRAPKIGFIAPTTRQNILKDLEFAAKNHFDYYEVGPHDANFSLPANIIKKSREIAKNNNIHLNLHVPYFLPVASLISEISEATLKFIKQEVVLANQLGAKRITLHSGKMEVPRVPTAVIKNFEVFIRNLKKIVGFSKKYSIKVGVENTFSEGGICRTAEELLKVTDLAKEAGIVFDCGHVNVIGENLIKYFKKVRNRVVNVHISDNNGKIDEHLPLGMGNINFKKLFKEFKKTNYYGPFILEVFPSENVLRAKNTFLKIWNEI